MKLTLDIPNDINDMTDDDLGKIYITIKKLANQIEDRLNERIDDSYMSEAYNKKINSAIKSAKEYDAEKSSETKRVFSVTLPVGSKVRNVQNPEIKSNSIISVFPSDGYERNWTESGYFVSRIKDGEFTVENTSDDISSMKLTVLIHKEAIK